MAQPMGPRTKWAAITDSTKLQKGTTIIEMTAGQILRKNFSRYTRVKAASMAGMTCAWYPIMFTCAKPKSHLGMSAAAVVATE